MKTINEDLGYTDAERYGESPISAEYDKDKVRYPEFTYSDDDEPLDIPDKGKMLVEYEEVSRVESSRNGKKHYVCTIAVKKIISVSGKEESKPKEERADEALDRIREALEKANSEEGEE